MEELVGYRQLKAIIGEIMELQDYPKWGFTNGVLNCKEVLGEYQLWFSWGKLRIVPDKDRYKDGLTAGDCAVLGDWNTENNGTMTLIPIKE